MYLTELRDELEQAKAHIEKAYEIFTKNESISPVSMLFPESPSVNMLLYATIQLVHMRLQALIHTINEKISKLN